MKKCVLFISIGLILSGLAITLYPAIRNVNYSVAQKRLKAGTDSFNTVRRNDRVRLPDGVVCVLSIPKIGLNLSVLEGTSDEILETGPGHYEETALPGAQGNCCIAGHRNISGSPFMDLDKLESHDELIVYTSDGKFVYRVFEKKIVVPTDVSVIEPSQDNRLTLTTCQRQGDALNRLIIVGQLVEG